ncbi:benzoylformate decarboxylase [Sciscionella sediminilitoris]|uniref:benzoylformate decarboxylase n=1 Tax=Sciscionella sediminilitoris TaxID=1445613 RepID=UPI0004DED5B5|nr:benzoylformate decarboxylase [Sciscionella sp. SE31]
MPTARHIAHEFLERNELTTIFGNPGSNELPFLTGLSDRFSYILGLHEGAVVGMADGYCQVTGKPALVNLHAAAGSGNGLGALTNAVYSRSPLVITAGQQVRPVIGLEGMLANVDATTLMRPLVGWSGEPSCAADVPRSLAQAVFEARMRKRPTYLSIPYDDWDVELDENARMVLDRSISRASAASTEEFAYLVARFESAKNPALVLGGDIDTAGLFDTAVALAEHLDVPTWAAPSAFRLPFPNRHRLFRGVLPAGISSLSQELDGHDLILVLGAPVFRYHQHEPGAYLPEGAHLVQVTDDAEAAARAPFGEAIVADPSAVMHAMLGRCPRRGNDEHNYLPNPEPAVAENALHPEQVFAALRDTQPAETGYIVESTSTNSAWWRQMDLRTGGSYFFPASGGLGFGIPAAVGAGIGRPDRHFVGVIGDGAANYGISALWTAARHRVPVTFVLLRNGSYGALQWFADLLDVPDVPGVNIPGLDFTQIAEGYGVPADSVTEEEELRALLAKDADGPRLIQVDTALTAPA